MLLERNFDISDQAEFDAILQQAAEAGFAEVIQFVQKKYASLYGELGSSQGRAVQVAILKGRMGVVERYIQKLNDPKVDMAKGAIATAALGGQNSMVAFLVGKGLDLNEEGVLGTPLRAASIMCHESTVRLLLRLGASLHVPGSFGEPLQAAAMYGHMSVTRALLSHGANVNSQGGLYGTALQAAAHRGHKSLVEILLDAGADVHQKGFSHDALHAASEGGHEGIVRLFLERGFKARHSLMRIQACRQGPSQHRNPLRKAFPRRYLDIMSTVTHQPALKGWHEQASVIEPLHVLQIMRGNVSSRFESPQPYRGPSGRNDVDGDEENYALRSAAAGGHLAVVKLLLSRANVLEIPDSAIVAAFVQACENGHERVVEHLLLDIVDVGDFQFALEVAAIEEHLAVVDLLLDHEERLGLARVETVRICRPTANDSKHMKG